MGKNRVGSRPRGRYVEYVRGPSDLNRPPTRRWKAAVRTALRENYRKEKNACIELVNVDGSKNDRTIIMVSILAQGSIQKRYNTCGKPKCRCNRDGKRHGPYWYLLLPLPMELVRKGMPKAKQFYLDEEEALSLKARITNYKALQSKVWNELYEELTKGGKLDKRTSKLNLYH